MNDLFTRSCIIKKVRLHEKRMVMKISNNQSDVGVTLTTTQRPLSAIHDRVRPIPRYV